MIIFLERMFIREDASVGRNVIKPMSISLTNVTAYVCVLSDTHSLEEDICTNHSPDFGILVLQSPFQSRAVLCQYIDRRVEKRYCTFEFCYAYRRCTCCPELNIRQIRTIPPMKLK